MNRRRSNLISIAVVAILCASASAAFAQNTGTASDVVEARIKRIENGLLPLVRLKGQPEVKMTLSERMKRFNVPGMSIAVIHEGKVEWARAYGVTQIGGAPVTTDTLFQAGSISKPVAAMGALKLVELGKLKLDEDVNAKLTSWKVPENEFTKEKKVTLHGILTHSAGLTVHGFPGYATTEQVPTLVQVLDGVKPPANTDPIRVDITPGTKWRYSGGGFTVMQLMMVDVTGKSFPQIESDYVLKPLGMSHSTYEQPLPKAMQSSAATPYYPNLQAVPGGAHTYPEMAAAGLWTTASDLARFAIGVQEALAGKRNPVLSQAMQRQMVSKQFEDWGLGFGVGGQGDTEVFRHNGVDEGFDAYLFAYSNTGNGVAIMFNANNTNALANEIQRAIAKEYNWPDFKQEERETVPVDAKVLDSYAGTYQLPHQRLTVSSKDGHLFMTGADGVPVELFASSPTKFFGIFQGNWYTFSPGDAGAVTMTISTPGGEVKASKVQ